MDRIKTRSVPVGNTGYFSEFVLDGYTSAFIKTSFAPTKKHFSAIEQAIAESKAMPKHNHVQQQPEELENAPKGRKHVSLKELLNPEQ